MKMPSLKRPDPGIEKQIKAILAQMEEEGVDSEEYSRYLTHLERLNDLKTGDRRPKVSLDSVLMVAGNLAGILIIVAAEKNHTITSKAFGEILRATRRS